MAQGTCCHLAPTTMDDTMLGINAASNPYLFKNEILQMLKKPLKTTTLVDSSTLDNNITNKNNTKPVQFEGELTGITGSLS
jgi:hypothetical protein